MVYRDMPRIVRAFHAQAPGMEVNLREMSSSEQIEALLHRQIHVGFINTSAGPARLRSVPLADDHFMCCLPDAQPESGGTERSPSAPGHPRIALASFKDTVRDYEITLLHQALDRTGWNKTAAAQLLRMLKAIEAGK